MKYITILFLSLSINWCYGQNSSEFIEVKNLEINSEYADFGVKFYKNDQVLFASSRKDESVSRKEQSRNRMQHLEFYKGTIDNDGELILSGRYSSEKYNMFYESDITFSPDGKTIYFTLNNFIDDEYAKLFKKSSSKSHILNIFKATIDDAGIATNIEPLPINSAKHSVSNPSLSPDGRTLYYASDADGGFGKTDIYKIAINNDGTYGTPENLGANVNSSGQELFPFESNSGELYFTSDRVGGFGYLDNYKSEINNTNYNAAENLGGLINSEYDDFALIVDHEKGLGFFSSSREGTAGADIFSFKVDTGTCNQLVAGVLKSSLTNNIVANATIQLFNGDDLLETILTDASGVYAFKVDCETSYQIKASSDGFEATEELITTSNSNNHQENFDLFIQPLACVQFITGIINDEKEGTPITNVELALYFNNTLLERTYSANDGSYQFNVKIDCNTTYKIKAETKNYLPIVKNVSTSNELNKQNNVLLEMKVIQDFVSVSNLKMIKTGPINFDLNESTIRKDAAIELEKVVDVMKKNPGIKIEVKTHTDSRAPDSYNLRLSDERAKSTAAYIISKGIAPDRVFGKGYGETELVNECSNGVKCTEAQHQANRRTEFIVIP